MKSVKLPEGHFVPKILNDGLLSIYDVYDDIFD